MKTRTGVRGGAAIAAAVLLWLLGSCAIAPRSHELPPIVFVHGNGDDAAVWMTTLWRYESNGWPRSRLFALSLPYPSARDDDTKPQEGRSSTDDYRRFLATQVERVLKTTGARQVVMIGSSRGVNAIRNYVENGAGRRTVSRVVLCGGTSHGVWADAAFRPNSEFNGAGAFIRQLNQPKGPNGDEVTPGVEWLTLRSDKEDKYTQADGALLGMPGVPTHITFDAPALKGALNLVLPGRDHREVAFHREAFARAYAFLTGHAPATLDVQPEAVVILDGVVSANPAIGPTNLPLVGARVEVYAVAAESGARLGAALSDRTVAADGHWGPLTTDQKAHLEFVIAAHGFATTHIYYSPFLRSSAIVDLRAEPMPAAEPSECLVSLVRARGYFGVPRDRVELDGVSPAPGIRVGVPTTWFSTVKLQDCAGRSVTGRFNDEIIAGVAWPAAEHHLVQLELRD